MPDFPGYTFSAPLPPAPRTPPPDTSQPVVEDVKAAFLRIRLRGDDVAVHVAGHIPERRYTEVHFGSEGRAYIHFQGVRRLKKGYALVTGGDALEPAAHLFVLRLGSRDAARSWGSNVLISQMPPDQDRVEAVVALDREFWHAGGLGVLGDVAVVPLEGPEDRKALIRLYDLRDPLQPRSICEFEGRSPKAGAASLLRLPGGRYLCGVWYDEGKREGGRHTLDLFLSATNNLVDGFLPEPASWTFQPPSPRDPDVLLGGATRPPAYQHITLLAETRADGGWSPWLVATDNDQDAAPALSGKNHLDLYRLGLPPKLLERDPQPGGEVALVLAGARIVQCRPWSSNLNAAAGLHVDEAGALHLYAGAHYRLNENIRLAEFRAEPDLAAPAIARVEDGWIDLYEQPGFDGRRLSLLGWDAAALGMRDYAALNVGGKGFDNAVMSARWQLPPGITCRLYDAPAFQLRDRGFLDLPGTGRVCELRDLRELAGGFDRATSSSALVPGASPTPPLANAPVVEVPLMPGPGPDT